jgi:hypothetical protein
MVLLHRKLIVVVASILFALLSVVAFISADLLDRSYPVGIGTRALVTMDFGTADIRDHVALEQLAALSDRFDMGLVRVLPELGGDTSAEVFVKVGHSGPSTKQVARFSNQPASRVADRSALAFSFADGTYLLTGSGQGDDALKSWMRTHRVVSHWEGNGAGQVLKLVLRQPPFFIAFLAALSLMTSLILYWVAVRARGRALRVLAGVPARRIQYEDLATLAWLVVLAAGGVTLVATSLVAATRGVQFTWYYASLFGTFELALMALAFAGILVMTSNSWPTEQALATRTPAVGSLGRTSKVVMAATFVFVLVAVGPTLQAQAESAGVAAQQARWRALSNQVLLNFPSGLGEDGFQRIRSQVGDVIADAERQDAVAMSYALSPHAMGLDGAAMKGYDAVALVNQRWLKLMAPVSGTSASPEAGETPEAVRLSRDQVPPEVRKWLDANLKIWVPRHEAAGVTAWWDAVTVLRYPESAGVALASGGDGDLIFPRSSLVLVVQDLHDHFDADFLASLATSRNLTFTGLQDTISLLAAHGLRKDLQVRYLAEAGILRAQFATYSAWLDSVSTVALGVAFVMATMVGALISGLLSARRDFPLRLAGRSWLEVLAPRLLKEWGVGLVLVLGVLVYRHDYNPSPVLVLALAGVLLSATMHVQVSRWAFANVSLRRL